MQSMALADALAAVDAAGGRLSLMGGRVKVDVNRELPEPVWEALAAHREELAASLAGSSQQAENPAAAPQRSEPDPFSPLSPFSPRHDDRESRQPLPLPAGVACCDRCGSTETTDSVIHGGRSVRQDCAVCGRFRKFVVWHGVTMP